MITVKVVDHMGRGPDVMAPYTDLLRRLLANGEKRENRTGIDTLSLFGEQIRFDLREGFPILTQRRLHWPSIAGELAWFLSGSTHVGDLHARGVTIWDEWATAEQCTKFGREPGDLGPVYGHQWRNFAGRVDQIAQAAKMLREDPRSRRNIVSAWNPIEADQVTLPPCHTLFQLHVDASGHHVSLHLYQRSADVFLGVPFNIASYALLLHLFARSAGMVAKDLIISFGDAHLYVNHVDQTTEVLNRTPRAPPTLVLRDGCGLDGFEASDARLDGYEAGPSIRAEVAV